MFKLVLKAELDGRVLEKLREILRNHEIKWEEEIIVKSPQQSNKELVKNRERSFEI